MGMGRAILAAVAFIVIAGATALWLSPAARLALATAIHPESRTPSASHGHAHGNGDHHGPPGVLKLSAEQITKAKIELAPAGEGTLTRRITVPGTIAPDADRIGRVAAKVIGTVAELRKRLGDPVAKGEVIAVLESREVADAKSDYLAALVQFELQQTLFEREQTLWEQKIIAEQQFLRARNAFGQAQVRVDMARQKLFALDLASTRSQTCRPADRGTAPQGNPRPDRGSSGRAPGRSRHAGRRRGAGEGALRHRRPVVGLDRAVGFDRGPAVHQSGAAGGGRLGREGRSGGRADRLHQSAAQSRDAQRPRRSPRSTIPIWRFAPGFFVTAAVTVENMEVELRVPRTALQTIAGEQVVFVRTEEGFEKREVVLGRDDGRMSKSSSVSIPARRSPSRTLSCSRRSSARPRPIMVMRTE